MGRVPAGADVVHLHAGLGGELVEQLLRHRVGHEHRDGLAPDRLGRPACRRLSPELLCSFRRRPPRAVRTATAMPMRTRLDRCIPRYYGLDGRNTTRARRPSARPSDRLRGGRGGGHRAGVRRLRAARATGAGSSRSRCKSLPRTPCWRGRPGRRARRRARPRSCCSTAAGPRRSRPLSRSTTAPSRRGGRAPTSSRWPSSRS